MNLADEKPRPRLLGGRIGRRAYWIYLAALILVGVALSFVLPSSASSPTAFVWFLLYAWRLHDFGSSAWWAAVLSAAPILIGAVGIIASHMIAGAGGPTFETLSAVVIVLTILIQVGLTIWVGSVRGDEGANRFGERKTYKLGRFTI